MSDHLINDCKTEESSNFESDLAIEAATGATITGTSTTITTTSTDDGHRYDDVDYPSETEADKPIILDIGTKSNTPSISIPTAIYANDYPLDMHMPTSHPYRHITASQFGEHSVITPLSTHLALYNNPFTSHLHQQCHQLPSATSITPIDIGNIPPIGSFSSLIPQPVCVWRPAETEVERPPTPEVVPPAMYMPYSVGSTREHIISKESNPLWKEKALQIEKDYKKTACDRERTRMRDMNRAFDLLRSKLPISKPNGKKYSKIESLRIAINYINHLQQCLNDVPQDYEMTPLSSNSMNYQDVHPSHNAIDYVMEMDARRYRDSFQYDSRNRSYQVEMERESDEQNRASWSDASYVPNEHDWD